MKIKSKTNSSKSSINVVDVIVTYKCHQQEAKGALHSNNLTEKDKRNLFL